MSSSKRKAILITGCDTGFGFSLALHSADSIVENKDFIVIATCFRPDDKGCQFLKSHSKFCENLSEVENGKKLFVLPLDVTDDESLKLAEIEVSKILQVSNADLWCVVNNAASPLIFGEAVWLTRQMVSRQYEVNVIGAWAVSQTFMPHLIKSKGRLVNIISFCTECPMPTLSVYTSTKAALKTLSDAMRMELAKYSVDVVLFNPGDHPTETPLCAGQDKNYQEMDDVLKSRFSNEADMLEMFSACRIKFSQIFPARSTATPTKLNSPGLYRQFERILFEMPRPKKYEYVNSNWMTRTYFNFLKVIPTSWSDKLRTSLMRLPK